MRINFALGMVLVVEQLILEAGVPGFVVSRILDEHDYDAFLRDGRLCGLGLGDAREDVIHALGDVTDDRSAGGFETLAYDDHRLQIGLHRGRVVFLGIDFRRPSAGAPETLGPQTTDAAIRARLRRLGLTPSARPAKGGGTHLHLPSGVTIVFDGAGHLDSFQKS